MKLLLILISFIFLMGCSTLEQRKAHDEQFKKWKAQHVVDEIDYQIFLKRHGVKK
jgi:uncharacterized protein YceK